MFLYWITPIWIFLVEVAFPELALLLVLELVVALVLVLVLLLLLPHAARPMAMAAAIASAAILLSFFMYVRPPLIYFSVILEQQAPNVNGFQQFKVRNFHFFLKSSGFYPVFLSSKNFSFFSLPILLKIPPCNFRHCQN